MTMRVSSGWAADSAAMTMASSRAAKNAGSCGRRCGHSKRRKPRELLPVDDTQRRQGLISAARQLQHGLLGEARGVVEGDIAVSASQIDLTPVRGHAVVVE